MENDMERLTVGKFKPMDKVFCLGCECVYDCEQECEYLKFNNRLAELEDRLESGALVEVVRCKDCKNKQRAFGADICMEYGFEIEDLDFYCRDGEKR